MNISLYTTPKRLDKIKYVDIYFYLITGVCSFLYNDENINTINITRIQNYVQILIAITNKYLDFFIKNKTTNCFVATYNLTKGDMRSLLLSKVLQVEKKYNKIFKQDKTVIDRVYTNNNNNLLFRPDVFMYLFKFYKLDKYTNNTDAIVLSSIAEFYMDFVVYLERDYFINDYERALSFFYDYFKDDSEY